MPTSRFAQSLEDRCISFDDCFLLCSAAPLKHLFYTTCAPNKRLQKITLRPQNVCSKISQLDKRKSKDASFGLWPPSLLPDVNPFGVFSNLTKVQTVIIGRKYVMRFHCSIVKVPKILGVRSGKWCIEILRYFYQLIIGFFTKNLFRCSIWNYKQTAENCKQIAENVNKQLKM